MSVDKFGLMSDDPAETTNTTIVHPIYKHASNLDDLENVEGFNEDGLEDQMYGFQLTKRGIYKRIKIDLSKGTRGVVFDNDGVLDRPMVLIYKGGQWLTMPLFHDYDIDIKLNNQTVSTKGENHVVHKIFNSGKIIGSLIPKKAFRDSVVLKKSKSELSVSTNTKKSVLIFKTEFDSDEDVIKKNQSLTMVCIEGYILGESNEFLNLVNGLKVKWKKGAGNDGLKFRISVLKEPNQFKVLSSPNTLETEFDQADYNMSEIFLSQNYGISRIRFTSNVITENEVMYM